MILRADVFVPDGDEARRWAEEELSRQEYQAAKPTWFDSLARDIVEGIADLFSTEGAGNAAPFATALIVAVVVAAIIVALIVWGRPRSPRAIRRRDELLGARDDRTAAQLRAEAERRARDGDWDGAVVLRFRALARGLIERDLIDPAPGATAQAIAREGGVPFPAHAERLHEAAVAFDRVRYLRTAAGEHDYRLVADTDAAVTAAAPAIPVPAADTRGVPA
ncbi:MULTISPECIES: DUF4129 domain-containing protein [Microbacterium]|uniref:DUF4129 domain-containing protein n=1 Tax=Microbacterium TaxID=33882 RepID=UPI00217D16DE|nr:MULTISPECIES: DUF4129 domain-containing protein [Microbacterium]UWF78208.1 DUF4129 domain-containing protein [Microbacterium neungamense]WCM56380.1 DUF4129 domain-containing protein [Microbacterium sp. EF45047]